MLRLDHLLCLVSPVSSPGPALRQALHLAAACDATVHVMSVSEAAPQRRVREAVAGAKERLGLSVPVEVHAEGEADGREATLRAVEEAAEKTGAELVVSDPLPAPADPSSGTPPWASVLRRQLACPIFMADACTDPDRVKQVLVPTDLSAASAHTLKYAVKVASCYDAAIVLLHVLEASPYVALTPIDRLSLGATTLSEHRARRRLQRLVREAGAEGADIRSHIAFGTPADQITRFVDESAVDLVVLSVRAGGASSEGGLGAVADGLVRRLGSPLVLVRAAETPLLAVEEERDVPNRHRDGDGSSVSSSR